MKNRYRFAIMAVLAAGSPMTHAEYVELPESAAFVDVVKEYDTEFLMTGDGYGEDYQESARAMRMDILVSNQGAVYVRAAAKPAVAQRDYFQLVTESERADIHYVVKTLGMSNVAKIGLARSELQKTKPRIKHVHPLNFLAVIFTDDKLIVSMRNLEDKTWVWKTFIGELVDSLTEEAATNNVLPFADDFARRIGVNPSLFMPTMQAEQWEKFVRVLIHGVPRQGQTGRYDM